MADEHARIDPLPAAVDTAFANPAHDRLAYVSDASAHHLDQPPRPRRNRRVSLIRTALTGAERKAVARR
jgi:hypothetical protein